MSRSGGSGALIASLVALGCAFIETPAIKVARAGESTGASRGKREDWPNVGNDKGGMRFSPLRQINRDNVRDLKVA
jgi:glucose dehydrogenase